MDSWPFHPTDPMILYPSKKKTKLTLHVKISWKESLIQETRQILDFIARRMPNFGGNKCYECHGRP